ncbi:MAG: type II toxin-antitoxin system Phd/YefM family antitoxin [Candidatus Dormibacteraceae bacterium]
MTSLTIGIREAKAQFSRLVSEVGHGTEWIITDRGRPVARLTPLSDLEASLEDRILRLEKWGWIEGAARTKIPVPAPINIGADAQGALQEDRGA